MFSKAVDMLEIGCTGREVVWLGSVFSMVSYFVFVTCEEGVVDGLAGVVVGISGPAQGVDVIEVRVVVVAVCDKAS